jgi:hypothetical protein
MLCCFLCIYILLVAGWRGLDDAGARGWPVAREVAAVWNVNTHEWSVMTKFVGFWRCVRCGTRVKRARLHVWNRVVRRV